MYYATPFSALLAIIAMSGCASVQNAGTASYSVRPFMSGDKAICCEVMVNNGKEIAVVDARVIMKGSDVEVRLYQEGVVAFEGQRIAAGAVKTLAEDAVRAAAIGGLTFTAPMLAPALGASLAAPGLPAAATGAAAAVGFEELTPAD